MEQSLSGTSCHLQLWSDLAPDTGVYSGKLYQVNPSPMATVGGNWRHWPAAFAHQHLTVPADHAQIVAQVLKSLRDKTTVS